MLGATCSWDRDAGGECTLTREIGIEDAGNNKMQAGLPASLQAKRMLSIKRVFPKQTANSSTLLGPVVSTGFNVSASATST